VIAAADMDERKIVSKKRKRGAKIEDCMLELEGYIRERRRRRVGEGVKGEQKE